MHVMRVSRFGKERHFDSGHKLKVARLGVRYRLRCTISHRYHKWWRLFVVGFCLLFLSQILVIESHRDRFIPVPLLRLVQPGSFMSRF